jgi:hypothetical protein
MLKLTLKGIKIGRTKLSLENLQINLKCQNQDWRFSLLRKQSHKTIASLIIYGIRHLLFHYRLLHVVPQITMGWK